MTTPSCDSACHPTVPEQAGGRPTVVGVTGSGAEAVQAIGKLRPNVEQRTVEYHVHSLFLKLDAHSRVELVRKAEEQGLL